MKIKSNEQNRKSAARVGTEQTTGNINMKNYRNKCIKKVKRNNKHKNEKLITY